MMLDIVSLYPNGGTYRHPLVLPIGLPESDRTMPSNWHLSQESMDMVSVGLEQGQ
jgi:hypothetical protein